MNYEQYLLIKLAEEAMEVGHMALKTAQFGRAERRDVETPTNRERLISEINDFYRIIKELNTKFDYDIHHRVHTYPEKEAKFKFFTNKAIMLGQVEEYEDRG